MKWVNKSFLLGCGTGAVLSVAMLFVAFVGGSRLFRDSIAERMAKRLKAPPIPSDAPVDFDWEIKNLDGAEFDMAAMKGKVVFLTFWSPDCLACLAELPSIQDLYEKMPNVEFVGISMGDSEELRDCVEARGITFPVYTLAGERPEMFRAGTVPATFIISPEGKVAFQHLGALNWDDERCVLFLERLGLSQGAQ